MKAGKIKIDPKTVNYINSTNCLMIIYIALALLVIPLIISCKNKEQKKIAIYPLRIYKYHGNDSGHVFFQPYVIYNLPDDFDADILKVMKITTKPFMDSIIKANPVFSTYQFEFYQKSDGLDTNYSDKKYIDDIIMGHYDLLYPGHYKERIGQFDFYRDSMGAIH